ncbi:Zinc finger and BTB domain-containing 22 [Gossypium arboreum]|uniref:Zinc finger and BTB domain-containing 22 n=1 Tax=Gossypium arboreum TaxID=29729 RepID=A0A0B0MSQ3_GOSAR|nr:Zinc finger and BTB domain-containing 22 [Gossypium arboreum]
MVTHIRVPGRAKTVGYTDLCHTAKSHAHVLDRVEHTDLILNSTPGDTRLCNITIVTHG